MIRAEAGRDHLLLAQSLEERRAAMPAAVSCRVVVVVAHPVQFMASWFLIIVVNNIEYSD